jgi:IS4 transposase
LDNLLSDTGMDPVSLLDDKSNVSSSLTGETESGMEPEKAETEVRSIVTACNVFTVKMEVGIGPVKPGKSIKAKLMRAVRSVTDGGIVAVRFESRMVRLLTRPARSQWRWAQVQQLVEETHEERILGLPSDFLILISAFRSPLLHCAASEGETSSTSKRPAMK